MSGPASLAALLSKSSRASRSSIVVAAAAQQTERSPWPPALGTVLPDRELARAIKGDAPAIAVVGRLSPTLLRALRAHPPALIVVVGDADDEVMASLRALPGTTVLGPRATVVQGGGDIVACAATREELTGLVRCLGPEAVRLALAPTPSWLCTWFADPALADAPVAGTVDAHQLSIAWARWATKRETPFVVVPLGVDAPPLSEPGHDSLSTAVAAHALERWTGPVFPSPRVIAAVLEGLRSGAKVSPDTATKPTAEQSAIWHQARRALPMVGAVLGMDEPRVDAGPAPSAAFLAQRALLRAYGARALVRRKAPGAPPADPEGVDRAMQLLERAGQVLTDHESKVVLRGFGVEVTRQAVANSASGATGFADTIGYPVVLKALSPDLRRRAELGAIELGLTTGAAVRRAYAAIVDNVERGAPTARLDGVLVAEMVPPGLDVHCGLIRLPGDGGLAIFGKTIEASTPIEPAMAPLPLAAKDATLLAHAILTRVPVPGLRRADDPDVHSLASLLRALAALAERAGERIEAVDLSPVRLVGNPPRTVVLDATICQRPHLEGR